MTFSILISANNAQLVSAIMNIADDNAYNVSAQKNMKYVIINTVAKTVTDAQYRGAATVASLATDMGTVVSAIEGSRTATRTATHSPIAAARRALPTSGQGANGIIRIGDKVVRVKQAKRAKFNAGTTNVVLTVTGFTANGKLILAGLTADQYSAKKFAKVTLSTERPVSGSKVVVIKESSDRKFALGLNKIYTFRGVTVEKGNYILDGQNVHQYAPSRFAVVKGL